jgi:hypothetical protein
VSIAKIVGKCDYSILFPLAFSVLFKFVKNAFLPVCFVLGSRGSGGGGGGGRTGGGESLRLEGEREGLRLEGEGEGLRLEGEGEGLRLEGEGEGLRFDWAVFFKIALHDLIMSFVFLICLIIFVCLDICFVCFVF